MIFAIGMTLVVVGYLVAKGIEGSRDVLDQWTGRYPNSFYCAGVAVLAGVAMCLVSVAMLAWKHLP